MNSMEEAEIYLQAIPEVIARLRAISPVSMLSKSSATGG
jgi:hypothetical protein